MDTGTDTVVVTGGQENENILTNIACWKVGQSDEIVHLCDIPAGDLGIQFSLCVIPQGFVITGGANKPLCMMFTTSTKSLVGLQNVLEQRCGHGSICVKNILYILGGFIGIDMECSDSVHSMALECGTWQNGPSLPLTMKYPKLTNLANTVYLLDAEDSTVRGCGVWMSMRESGMNWHHLQYRIHAVEQV